MTKQVLNISGTRFAESRGLLRMAKLVYGLQQSLDGYVDHQKLGPPGPGVFQHFVEHVRDSAGALYGGRTYEIMRYWDDDQPGWDKTEHEFAAVWRRMPKWVMSRTLKSVGPNATLLTGELESAVRELKAKQTGEIDVVGPHLAGNLTELGLIDEYRLYLRPVVLGGGVPFFIGAIPKLRLTATDPMAEDMVRLTYVPA